MLGLIFLSPLLLVILAALALRFRIRVRFHNDSGGRFTGIHVRHRPFQTTGWALLTLGVATAVYLPLCFHVWLPDVLFAPHRTLAATASPGGYAFRVVQYWNRCDFYSTELHVTPPNAPTEVFTLDGDDFKTWSVPLAVNEDTRVATVTLSGERTKSIQW